MRKFIKKNLIDLIDTVKEVHQTISTLMDNYDVDNASILLSDCQEFAESIYSSISDLEGENHPMLQTISYYYQNVFNVYNGLTSGQKCSVTDLNSSLDLIRNGLINDVSTTYEIAFLPYKAAMWDSFDSIYDAAISDPRCTVKVIPIPYYDLHSDRSFGQLHYEADMYPDHIGITRYDEYDFESNRPDVIYIHNPYDNSNTVTSVDSRFYSKELKKYTDMLVYVPYHISGVFANYDTVIDNIPMAFLYVDKIIVQSENIMKYYMYGGIPERKFIKSGSPKIDYVINKLSTVEIPNEWINKINCRKTVLINSTIGRVLSDEKWIDHLNDLFEIIKTNKDLFYIWRPHPLLEQTIQSMRPNIINDFKNLMELASKTDNIIIDSSTSAYPSIKISDGMISDYSSLAFQYLFTGKPVFITGEKINQKDESILAINYTSAYFDSNMSYVEFLSLVQNGNDYLKEKRLQDTHESVYIHKDTCGNIIHNQLLHSLTIDYS